MRLLQPHRRMVPLGCHLLVENVFDIVGAKGLMEGGPVHRVQQSLGTIVVFKCQELFHLLFQGLVGGGHVLQISLGGFP
jgi:hypothetical protein